MYIRRIFFFCVCALLVCVALFPIQIFLTCARYQIVSYFKQALHAEFSCEALLWEEGKIVCKNGVIKRPGSLETYFSKALLSPHICWKEREIGGNLEIKELRVIHYKVQSQYFAKPHLLSFPFFSIHLDTTVVDGNVILYEDFEHCHCLQFDVEHYLRKEGVEGKIGLCADRKEQKLQTHFCHAKDQILRLQTTFCSHEFAGLHDLALFFFERKLPDTIVHWNVIDGKIEGDLDLTLVEGELMHLKGDVALSGIQAKNSPLEVIGEIDLLQAAFDIDCSTVSAMNGTFLLKGGRLALGDSREFWQGMWDLKNLNTTICVKDGKVESSTLKGRFMGMDGELLLDWGSADVLMNMRFEGDSQDMFALFPSPFQCAFASDHFALNATLNRLGSGLELKGFLSISDEENYELEFGCLFGQAGEEIRKIELLPSMDVFLDNLAEQFYLSQKRYGWFKGEGFPIEKFLSPFLFQDVHIEASGRMNFHGTFDEKYLVISYDGDEFSLEGTHFQLQAECIKKKIEQVNTIHYIDLETWDHLGFLPLKGATYYQKNRDVLFTNAQAMIRFENQKIYIEEIETYWEELLFEGSVEITAHACDDVDLKILVHHLEGPASSAQHFLSHFSHSIFWDLPFQGEVSGDHDPIFLHYHFSPKAERIAGYVQGTFSGEMEQCAFDCFGSVAYDFNEIILEIDSSLCAFHGRIGETIDLEGEGIYFQAVKQGQQLSISQCNYGPWTGKGDLEWVGNEMLIHHLVIQEVDKKGLFSFSGAYDRESKHLNGEIEKIKWDFGKTLSSWEAKGEIFGSGTFQWEPVRGAEAWISASFKDLECGGIHFGEGEDLCCHFSSHHGLSVEGLQVEIPTAQGIEKYRLGRFFYNLAKKNAIFEAFAFSLPPEKLGWVAQLATTLFPGKVHSTAFDWIEVIKQDEPFEGQISVEISPDDLSIHLSMKDGVYYLGGKKLDIKDFHLRYDPVELNIWSRCFLLDQDYWVHLQTDSELMYQGSLAISKDAYSSESLKAKWKRQPTAGFFIEKMWGRCQGITIDLSALEPNHSDMTCLEGEVTFDASAVYPFISKLEEYAVSGEYALKGTFSIPQLNFSDLCFSGTLEGQAIGISKLELATLKSELIFQLDKAVFSNFSIKDWAGKLAIDRLALEKPEESWTIELDCLKLEEMRFSRLQSPWTKWTPGHKPFFRSFFIKDFELNYFQGELSRLSTLTGSGILNFTNLPKRTLFTDLLFLPAEITARIGLDLTALIPVMGTIEYQICDGKIYLNEFKNMYSSGKHSRFYLADGGAAYIDFDGNLNLQFKTKQYNLLMKLAEFFTVTVKGTLLHPKYTLSNQLEDS